MDLTRILFMLGKHIYPYIPSPLVFTMKYSAFLICCSTSTFSKSRALTVKSLSALPPLLLHFE